MKRYLGSLPLPYKLVPNEILYLYLTISDLAINSVLVRQEGMWQKLVYCISRILRDEESLYPRLEKMVYMLVI